MARQRLVIVGLGMAASRLLDELIKTNAQDQLDIVVFGEESFGGYNRILLSHVLSGEQSIEGIVSHDQAWFDEHKIIWYAERKVIDIDTKSKKIIDAQGECHDYDLLVIATGSLPLRAAVPGNTQQSVMSFRDLLDAKQLLTLKANAGPVLVVGAGLLGLEAAYGMIKQGFSVTVIHRSDRIMSQQLDHAAASLLQAQLESLGIKFILSTQLTEICGKEQVEGVRLTTGEYLKTQTVLMAMGIRPNAELAKQSGLAVNRGVVVDDHCRTSAEDVYALGECSECEGHTYGLVAPIYRQVSVLVNQLMGDATMRFRHEETPTQLKVSGVTLFSFGSPLANDETQVLCYQNRQQQWYRKLVLDAQHRVIGAVMLGNTQSSQAVFQRYLSADPLAKHERALLALGQLTRVSEGV